MTDQDASRHLSEFTPTADSARDFRDALGCFGTGVTIITALADGAPLAMTANSFSAVSLDPPLVLWCPALKSPRHDPMVEAFHYSIHVVSEDQQDLASHFAKSGEDFAGIDWTEGHDGVPHLAGCLARFDCRRHAVHEGGDHSIVVGRVLHAAYRPGKGLIFKRGRYGGFAGPV